jgi:hypothetical protein
VANIYDADALAPAFATEERTAEYLGVTKHELYLRRRRGDGPPFVMHGARIRYPIAELHEWAQSLPRFSTLTEAYAAHPQRAAGVVKQRTANAKARSLRWLQRRSTNSPGTASP